jgi:hypothetical protein
MPVLEFLNGIKDRKERAAMFADLAMLEEEGPVLPFPLSSGIVSFKGLRELRTRVRGSQYRIVYLIDGSEVVLLHAFKKTATNQTRREYQLAADRARSLK